MSKKTQRVQERLALAAQAAAAGNHQAAANYAQAAANIQGSGQAKVQQVANQYATIAAASTPASPAPDYSVAPPAWVPISAPEPARVPSAAEIAAEMARLQEEARVNQALKTAKEFFTTYGLDKLWAGVEKYIRNGYSDMGAIAGALSRDPEYQNSYFERFPAVQQIRELNKQRIKDGMPIMAEPSPATYVELERSYRQAVTGLPPGLFGKVNDITSWIVKDVSPTEVKSRADVARNYINYSANENIKGELRRLYAMTDSEMAAYVLDPERTLGYVENMYQRRLATATVGGAAKAAGMVLKDAVLDQIGQNSTYGASYGNSLAQFNAIDEIDEAYQKLSNISNVDSSVDELVTAQFGLTGAAEAKTKKARLASQERARFSGRSGVAAGSLSAGRKAQ